jgi:hypothetical protein
MTTIRKIKDIAGVGKASLYQLSESVMFEASIVGYDDYQYQTTNHIVISGINANPDMFAQRPETLIFAANEEGEILSWIDLDGGIVGINSHEEVIRRNGWELIND